MTNSTVIEKEDTNSKNKIKQKKNKTEKKLCKENMVERHFFEVFFDFLPRALLLITIWNINEEQSRRKGNKKYEGKRARTKHTTTKWNLESTKQWKQR